MEDEVSHSVDDGMSYSAEDVKPKKKIRHRKKRMYQMLQQQMEFYFSDANLTKDRFFGQLLEQDPYIDLEVFMKCNKIRAITSDVQDIVKVIGNSDMLELSSDGRKVCRTTPIQKKEDADDCTIYVEQLPFDADHDWLKDIFSSYGKVLYVSIPKFKTGRIKGFGFVEFDTPESAKRALEVFGAAGCCLPSNMPPEQLWSIRTFESENADVKSEQQHPMEEEEQEQEQDKGKEIKVEEQQEEEEAAAAEEEEEEQPKHKKSKKEHKHKSNNIQEGAESEKTENNAEDNQVSVEPSSNKEKIVSTSDVCKKSEVNVSSNKRKLERVEGEADDSGNESEKDNKRTKLETGDDEIEKENEDGSNEDTIHKKMRRKRIKKSKPSHLEVLSVGVQILPKIEWKRLRNKYLNLQRKNFQQLKKSLRYYHNRGDNRGKPGGHLGKTNKQNGAQKSADIHTEEERAPSKPRVEFTPGVIVEVKFDEPLFEVKVFKKQARSHSDIEYVDAKEGVQTAYLRLANAVAAQNLMNLKPWKDMTILEGSEEKEYWDKIVQDRTEKVEKKIRTKHRGKDKLMRRGEKALHIRFDEIE